MATQDTLQGMDATNVTNYPDYESDSSTWNVAISWMELLQYDTWRILLVL